MATPELVLNIEVVSEVQKQIQDTQRQLQEMVRGLQSVGAQGGPQVVKKGLDEAGKAAQGATANISQMVSSLRGAQDPVSKLITNFRALAGAVAGLAIVKVASDLVQVAARAQSLGQTLQIVGQNAGLTAKAISDADKSVQSLGISSDTARKGLTSLVQSNISLEQATKLAAAAQDISTLSGKSASETFQDLTRSIQFASSRFLRQLGLTVDQAAAERALAQELGKTAESLTLNERRQALLNATLAEAAKLQGAFSKSLETASAQLRLIPQRTEDLQEALGENLLPTVTVLAREFNNFLARLTQGVTAFNAGSTAAQDFANTISIFVKGFFELAELIAVNIRLLTDFLKLLVAIKAGQFLLAAVNGFITLTGAITGTTAAAQGLAVAFGLIQKTLLGLVVGFTAGKLVELGQLFLENRDRVNAAKAALGQYQDTLGKLRSLDTSSIASTLREGTDITKFSPQELTAFRNFVDERKKLVTELNQQAVTSGREDLVEQAAKLQAETNRLTFALKELDKVNAVQNLNAELAKLPDNASNVAAMAGALRELTQFKFEGQTAELTRIFSLTEQANRIAVDFRGTITAQRNFINDSIGLARERADKLVAIAQEEAVKSREALQRTAPKLDSGEIADRTKFAQDLRKIAEGLAQNRVQAEQTVLAEIRKNLDSATQRFIKYKDDVIALTNAIANERISREQQIEALQNRALGRTGTFFEQQRLEEQIRKGNFDALVAESKGDFEKAKGIRDELFKAAVQIGNLGEIKDAQGKVLATDAQTAAKGLELATSQQQDIERIERQRLDQAKQREVTEKENVETLKKQATEQEKLAEAAQGEAIKLKLNVSEEQVNEVIDQAQKAFDQHTFNLKVQANKGDTQLTIDQVIKDVQDDLDQKTLTIKINAEFLNPALAAIQAQIGGASTAPTFASGGKVPGTPQSETSDNVLAMLTPGEMVTRVRAVKHYGEDFFQRLNRMQIPKWSLPAFAFGGTVPRFQDGGVVGTQGSFGAAQNLTDTSGLLSADKPFEAPKHAVTLDLGFLGTFDMQGSDNTIERLKMAISQAATKRRRS